MYLLGHRGMDLTVHWKASRSWYSSSHWRSAAPWISLTEVATPGAQPHTNLLALQPRLELLHPPTCALTHLSSLHLLTILIRGRGWPCPPPMLPTFQWQPSLASLLPQWSTAFSGSERSVMPREVAGSASDHSARWAQQPSVPQLAFPLHASLPKT